ncbi:MULTISPECIES: MFS transporter [Clavibacter]|uniref:MFS transporter n=2 Tax=Clavibacter TaxID=1573 RepID=A0A2S5VLW6_9MICO|nr:MULTISPECIES: MFS transporter [Clavibacter]KDP91513.1 MdtG [Clavibacter cf. michiganensis LMG 26808]PPF63912.1 MFS transporter [Clavibacter michiganensis]RII98883.1 MFS transporter [Clavibacter michiganensis]UKF25906.1 MFS transporter [Clavibacter sp. A6099]
MTSLRSASDTSQIWRRNLLVCALGSFTTIIGMTLILPILPLYVRDLGVEDPAAVTLWSGIAYAATFLTAALTAPLWGYLGDRFGRKPMLIRASLGMAIAMSLIGLAQDVTQLVLLRLLVGLLGGYASGSTILVAAQTPKDRSAWALGVLSSAIMAGTIAGPLIGGTLAQTVGVQGAFLATGGLIFIAFLGTTLFLKELPRSGSGAAKPKRSGSWAAVPHKLPVLALLSLSTLLMFATISVEPIIAEHVRTLTGSTDNVAIYAAVVFSLTAFGTILSGPNLGKLADRIGHMQVLTMSLIAATIFLAAQSFADNLIMFAILRFLTGVALGGITPTVVATIRRLLPDTSVGLVLGYNVSAQYIGQVAGPILAGWLGGTAGTSAVFLATAIVTALGLVTATAIRRHFKHQLAQ